MSTIKRPTIWYNDPNNDQYKIILNGFKEQCKCYFNFRYYKGFIPQETYISTRKEMREEILGIGHMVPKSSKLYEELLENLIRIKFDKNART